MDNGDQQERDFLAWFTAHGGWIDGRLRLQQVPGMGRGLVATAPITENERMFTIPRSMLMNLSTSALITRCEAAEAVRAPAAGLAWLDVFERGWCPLILMMMFEHWRAATSQAEDILWGPYFGIMPHTFTTPMFWSTNDLKQLQGTDIEDKIGKAEAEADYREFVRPYLEQYPSVFVGNVSDVQAALDTWYSVDMYHRMGSSILSRSFHVKRDLRHAEPDDADVSSAPAEVGVVRAVPGDGDDEEELEIDENDDDEDEEAEEEDVRDISMVPMADMLNARFGSENTRLFYKREALEMRCTKPIATGEQLLNTYGNPPNSDLLRRYGFVDEPNRGDLVELPLSHVVDAAVAKLAEATHSPKADVHARLSARFEWACTELGIDEVFLLARLSKPESRAPYSSTLALDSRAPLDQSQKRTLSRAASEIPEELVGFTRLLIVSQHGYEKAQKREALPNGRLDAVEEVDGGGVAVAVASVLLDAVARRAAQYPTAWDATAELLRTCSAPTDSPTRMALVVRAGDETILAEHTTVLSMILEHARAEAQSTIPPSKRRK